MPFTHAHGAVAGWLLAGMVALSGTLAAGAQEQTPRLWWRVAATASSQSLEGLTYDYFEPRDRIDLSFTFIHETGAAPVRLPGDFLTRLKWGLYELNAAGRAVQTRLEWQLPNLATSVATVPLGPGQAVWLQPGDRIEATATLRPAGGGTFRPVVYRLVFDLRDAVGTIRLSDLTTPWQGMVEPEGSITVRLLPPATAGDRRRHRLLQAHNAEDAGDYEAALSHFRELLRMGDETAHAGIGLMLLELGRYEEAAAELEIAWPLQRGEKSLLPVKLAEAYVALDREADARRMLGHTIPPERIDAMVVSLREMVRRRRLAPGFAPGM